MGGISRGVLSFIYVALPTNAYHAVAEKARSESPGGPEMRRMRCSGSEVVLPFFWPLAWDCGGS